MAISIDFATKIISVPQADCILVSGSLYRLPTKTVFRSQVIALAAAEEGVVFPPPIDHNADYTVFGVTFAPKVEVINGYSVTFTPDTQWSVLLEESNNNIADIEAGILNPNNVTVVPNNSAGLIQISTGSGLSATQDSRLKDAWDILRGKNVINRTTGNLEVYDSAGVLLYTAPIFEDAAGTIPVGAASTKIDRRDRLT